MKCTRHFFPLYQQDLLIFFPEESISDVTSRLHLRNFGYFQQVQKVVDLVKAKGGKVAREPGPVKGGKSVIAFVEDPTGYKFELIQREPTPEPLCQVMLRVGDLDRSIAFYETVMVTVWDLCVIMVCLSPFHSHVNTKHFCLNFLSSLKLSASFFSIWYCLKY